jgi:glutathione S-transferase
MANLKLFFFPGTCARVALIALEQTGALFETTLVNFAVGEHRSPAYLRINPQGKVPTLMIDGRPLTENIAILSWLSRTYPRAGLLPVGIDMRGQIDALSDLSWCASSIHPIVTRLVLPQLFCDSDPGVRRVWELAVEAMHWHTRLLEQRLGDQPWMLSEWSVVDAYVQWLRDQMVVAGFDATAYPNLNAHAQRHAQQAAVQRALARERSGIEWMAAQGFPTGPPRSVGQKHVGSRDE